MAVSDLVQKHLAVLTQTPADDHARSSYLQICCFPAHAVYEFDVSLRQSFFVGNWSLHRPVAARPRAHAIDEINPCGNPT